MFIDVVLRSIYVDISFEPKSIIFMPFNTCKHIKVIITIV